MGRTTRKKRETMTEALKQAIRESGMAFIAIERETGVQRMSIARFVEGRQSLRLDAADRLAGLFGIEVRRKRQGR
jgi:plasmid maintenance system antidote protein VapI